MSAAEAYADVVSLATAAVKRAMRDHWHYGYEQIHRGYERVHGAYEVAVMWGLPQDAETPTAWAARMEREGRNVAA